MEIFENYEFYNAEAGARAEKMSNEGLIATYVYSPNVYTCGEQKRLCQSDRGVRTVAVDGVSCSPLCFFTDFLGAELSEDCGSATLSLNGKSVTLPIKKSRGGSYLPTIEAATALGLFAKGYIDNRLTVIGRREHIAELDGSEDTVTALSYLVFGKYDPYAFTPEDYKAARAKMRVKLVGSPEINDLSNPTIKKKVEAITKTASDKWNTMHKEPDRFILWGDNPPVESEELGIQYSGLRAMARAFGTYGSELYLNPELERDVVDGVRWMYENMYGEAEIAGTGWRDAHLFNWYFWFISAPDYLSDILCIMENSFTLEERRTYLKCFDWCSTFMRHWPGRDTALSRISVCTKVGITCEYPERLRDEFADFDLLLGLEETAEGPRVDYVQWTHGMPYNNAYGKLNLDRVLFIASALAGTPAEFTNPKQYNQFMLVKYMFEAAMYKGQAFLMFCGRSVHITESGHGGAILADILQMYGMFGEYEDNYIRRLIKRNAVTPAVINAIKTNTDFLGCRLVDEILADDSISAENDYEYAHAWFTGDRAAQHRSNYAFGIAMSSKREPAYECINSANQTGWYTGDGATYLYTDYDRHQHDNKNFIKSNESIAYRFPGTTEDSQPRVARAIRSSRAWHPSKSFAGSMQIDDKYIVAAMDFESYSFDGPDDLPDDSGYGGGLPIHKNDLRAKKSWFCFDDEIICLGAGISSTMDSPVHTTVEHRRIVAPESDNQYVSGELLPKECYEKRCTGADFVNLEAHAGYVFLDGKDVYVNRYECESADGQSYIEIGIDHGANPTDATYAYAILPYAENGKLAEYAKEPDVEIISNTPALQIVRERNLDMTCYVFHEAGDKGGIMSDSPCIVTMTQDTLSVCDPTHEQKTITLTVWRELEITEMSEKMKFHIRRDRTILTVDVDGANGRKIELKFVPTVNNMKYRVTHSEQDHEEFISMTENGATALFLYSPNVISNGKIRKYDEENPRLRSIAKGGVTYVPESFFERFLGSAVKDSSRAIKSGKDVYLPVIECARELGFTADAFYSDRLIVIGTPEHIEALYKSENLAEAGAYAVFGDYDASSFTHEDYKLAKDMWRLRLVGSPEINDLSDEAIKKKCAWVSTKCKRALEGLNRSADRVILWGDKPPVESDDLWQQYIKIEDMAIAWGTYGSEYYHDESVLSDVLNCMLWMYENMYGEAEIAGTGWRNVREFNWWHWFVGAPDCLTNAMLVVEDYLTLEEKEKYLKCYKWVTSIMYAEPRNRSGASSRLIPGTKCALLLEDPRRLERAQIDCDSTMGLCEYGAGVHKADYVNWTHSCPHNISYGVLNLQRGLFVASILAQTPLDFSGPKRYNQFNLIKYSFEPAMYRSQGFMMFSGRSTFGVERSYGASVLAAALPMIGCFGEDEDRYIKSFIKRHTYTPELVARVKDHCSIFECAKLNDLLADESIPSDNLAYEYAHAWFTGDRAAQHMRDYAFGIALSSGREKSYECINSANKRGWYTGDGATYLYTTYDGNQYDGKNFLLNNEAVAYRYPGTTEDSRPRVARSIRSEFEWYSKNDFAGSMQFYDKYITAAMDFISLNCEGPDLYPDDYGYGGSQPIHKNDLVCKKAWFCLDGKIVCLGAGITSTMDSPVHTTVEHRRIVAPESDNQYVSGELLPKESYEKRYTGARWVLMDGHAGYVFPNNSELLVSRYICEEAENQSFFEVRILHGTNPTDAGYAYVVVPYATEEKLEACLNSPDFEIISNTKSLQAVRSRSLDIASYIFHEAGECDGIKVDNPCIVMLGKRGDEYTLAVTDPTQKLRELSVTLDRKIDVVSKNHKIAVSENEGKTTLTANVFISHGRKYEIVFK
ncbi:MAG: hypothetical protein IJ515_03025 [Clostridia bacterium]|nr:hypothetical protein [Clostridia bacterium]